MKFCTNPRCEGACVYEGVSSVNGAIIEYYRCLRCFTLHKKLAESAAPLIASDMDDPDEIHEWMYGGDIPVGLDHTPLLSGDEDTQELPRVIETGAQS